MTVSTADLLAQLRATTAADQKAQFADALRRAGG